jgi:hypothetical protein
MTQPIIVFQKHDQIVIQCDGRTLPGFVVMASPNGVSLMIAFEAMLDGHVGMMPVMWDADLGAFRSIVTQIAVKISRPQ